MFKLNKTYLESAQINLAWSLPSVSRTYRVWFLVSLPPSMTFHPHPEVMQPFLVSSNTNFFYHPSTYSNSLEALVSWPNGSSFIRSNCLLISVVCWGQNPPSLMTSKHSSPCLHLLAMLYIGHNWTQLVLPEAVEFVVFVPQLSQHIVYQPWPFAKVVQCPSLQTRLMLIMIKM